VPLAKSDHVCLTWNLSVKTDQEEKMKETRLNYWKGNYDNITAQLDGMDWEVEFAGRSLDDMWSVFKSKVIEIARSNVPLRRPYVKKKKSEWMTKDTKQCIKDRNSAWGTFRNYRSQKNYERYRKLRNSANTMVRTDHSTHRKQLIQSFKGNPKKFYGYVRSLQAVKEKVRQLAKKNGDLTETDQEAAELLCETFQEEYVREDDVKPGDVETIYSKRMKVGMLPIVFDCDAIKDKLKKLKPDKSPGPDEIHPMMLQRCATQLARPLAIIFQKSYEIKSLPNDWKEANVSPIFKKGQKNDPGNYRPISLTSVPCKVMESIIKEKLLTFLEEQGTMTSCQHGFTAGRSCLTNLLETLEAWTRLLDDGFGIDVIYLDYRKAFDTVPHGRLIEKLRSYGIAEELITWITAFLVGRKMRVGVNGKYSTWADVLSGVPQGSVLGPLLFLLFVNDLPDWVVNSIKMFADDTKIWSAIQSAENSHSLQDDLNTLTEWSKRWLLKFNPKKCKVMHIGHHIDTGYTMLVDGIEWQLEEIKEEKDLGVWWTDDLKPSRQCAMAAKKATSVLGLIRRNFKLLDVEEFMLLYKAYIRPHIEYCVQSWSPYLQRDITCLEQVQRRATKIVGSLKKKSYEERLKCLRITTLEDRRGRGDLIETYKILTGKEHTDYQQFFQFENNGHGLRGHSLKLFKTRSNSRLRQKFFSQRVIEDWNRLPLEVVEAPSVNAFKNRLDKFLKQKDMGI
jgi:hypothetical protein